MCGSEQMLESWCASPLVSLLPLEAWEMIDDSQLHIGGSPASTECRVLLCTDTWRVKVHNSADECLVYSSLRDWIGMERAWCTWDEYVWAFRRIMMLNSRLSTMEDQIWAWDKKFRETSAPMSTQWTRHWRTWARVVYGDRSETIVFKT